MGSLASPGSGGTLPLQTGSHNITITKRALCALALATTTVTGFTPVADATSTDRALVATTLDALSAVGRLEVANAAPTAAAPTYATWLASQVDDVARSRARHEFDGFAYTSSTTRLTSSQVLRNPDGTATVTGAYEQVWTLADTGGSGAVPPTTATSNTFTASYSALDVLQNLVSDGSVPSTPDAEIPVADDVPIATIPHYDPPVEELPTAPGTPPQLAVVRSYADQLIVFGTSGPNSGLNAPNAGHKNAADYATSHSGVNGHAYNAGSFDFVQFGGDCTNFVSQAMRVGGFGDYVRNGIDWADSPKKPQGSTPNVQRNGTQQVYYGHTNWRGVWEFAQFLAKSGRADQVRSAEFAREGMTVGDVVQMDFAWESKRLEHSVVITGWSTNRIGSARPFFTYDTSNQENISESDFIKRTGHKGNEIAVVPWKVHI